MSSVFAILFLLSSTALIIGLIKPSIVLRSKNPTRRKILILYGGISLLLLFLIGIVAPEPQDIQAEPTPTLEKQKKETKQAKVEATNKPTVKRVSISEKLWQALDTSLKDREGYDLEYIDLTKTAKLSYTESRFWDDNDLVRKAYSTLVKFGLKAFKIDNVDQLMIIYRTEFVDKYGKESVKDAVKLAITKIEFAKYDWENLQGQPIYEQMVESTSTHYIHPGVFKNLDFDKLYLVL